MNPPFSRHYDLGALRTSRQESVSIVPSEKERDALAPWAEIERVDGFTAELVLTRRSASRFSIAGRFSAAIVQNCVVTLEPVPAIIEREFVRELLLISPVRGAIAKELQPPLETSDASEEEIESLDYDLAAPLLEEFSLAVDPYPRAPGVHFEPPRDEAPPESPFAALKGLKR